MDELKNRILSAELCFGAREMTNTEEYNF